MIHNSFKEATLTNKHGSSWKFLRNKPQLQYKSAAIGHALRSEQSLLSRRTYVIQLIRIGGSSYHPLAIPNRPSFTYFRYLYFFIGNLLSTWCASAFTLWQALWADDELEVSYRGERWRLEASGLVEEFLLKKINFSCSIVKLNQLEVQRQCHWTGLWNLRC